MSVTQIGDAIIDLIMAARTPTRHLLSIDGLDKAITENDSYWRTVAALIRVADYFNRTAISRGAFHLFLIIMCRSDVFRRMQLADAPKISADGGVRLEWHAEAAEPKNVLLWRYLAAKAEITDERLLRYLPLSVPVGGGGVETLKYLLEFTRYMPRDATLLFNELQQAARDRGNLTGDTVRAAADSFARNHLLDEIVAEATGLLPSETVKRLQTIIAAVPKRRFSRADLQQALTSAEVTESSAHEVGEYLFLQGALGNYDPNTDYVQFYHRRDVYGFKASGPWVLHTGLAYALNKAR